MTRQTPVGTPPPGFRVGDTLILEMKHPARSYMCLIMAISVAFDGSLSWAIEHPINGRQVYGWDQLMALRFEPYIPDPDEV